MENLRAVIVKRLKWNYYQQRIKDLKSGLRMVPERVYFPAGEPAQMPAVFFLYRQLEHYHRLWWPGELADQPHFLMLEFDVCRAAEAEFRNIDLPPMQAIEIAALRQLEK